MSIEEALVQDTDFFDITIDNRDTYRASNYPDRLHIIGATCTASKYHSICWEKFLTPERLDECSGLRLVVGDFDDQRARKSYAGTANYFRDRGCDRVLLETPHDDEWFCSFAASAESTLAFGSVYSLLVSSDVKPILDRLPDPGSMPYGGASFEYVILIIPLIILEYHLDRIQTALLSLIQKVDSIEKSVSSVENQSLDLNVVVGELNLCNMTTIELERRWRFGTNLGSMIKANVQRSAEDFSTYGKMQESVFNRLHGKVKILTELHQSFEYDISILPRRISNQFTTVYNLIAQRDTMATIELATNSHRTAEAALRDSSSMKTIAAMTLIFLPATFICSFFSMTFFDWRPSPGEKRVVSLWVYFVVAIPLTLIVILFWIFWTKKSRESIGGWVAKRRDTLLPISEKDVRKEE